MLRRNFNHIVFFSKLTAECYAKFLIHLKYKITLNKKTQPNAQQRFAEIAKNFAKLIIIFRKKFYLSRKKSVTKFATSASRNPLAEIFGERKQERKDI